MRPLPVLFLAVLSLTCGGGGPVPQDLPYPGAVALPFGSTVQAGGLKLTFTEVVADGRCPQGAQCLVPGDAEILVDANAPCRPLCEVPTKALRLHTTEQPQEGEYLGTTVSLVALRPQPPMGGKVPPQDYVAWVRIGTTP